MTNILMKTLKRFEEFLIPYKTEVGFHSKVQVFLLVSLKGLFQFQQCRKRIHNSCYFYGKTTF